MSDALDEVLRLVAEGHLSADEAAPVIDALQFADELAGRTDDDSAGEPGMAGGSTAGGARGRPRVMRLEVTEGGRKVVNLRVPLSLGQMGLDRIPGISADNVSRIREALDEGLTGPVLIVDEDDGDSVRIVLE
jgi:hypothetical protein